MAEATVRFLINSKAGQQIKSPEEKKKLSKRIDLDKNNFREIKMRKFGGS